MSVAKKRLVAGLQAAGFVVITLAAWWLFASAAETVVSCVPWGLTSGCKWPFHEQSRLGAVLKATMFVVSLVAAIWVANRMFYTPETYEPVANK